MADIDVKPLFQYPETTDTLISYLEATRKALRTGQFEPFRHFLQVRLQETKDREHFMSLTTKWSNLLRMGQGQVKLGKHDMMGHMPVGYIATRFKGKTVLRKVIEPQKAFTDKVNTPLKSKAVPSQVTSKRQKDEIALESYSIPSNKLKRFGMTFGMAKILLRAGLEELAISDDGLANYPSGLKSRNEDGTLEDISYFKLVEMISEDADSSEVIEDDGVRVRIAVANESYFLPSLIGLLIQRIPAIIKLLEKPQYADKYPKLLKAIQAVQEVVEVIQSDK